ncbi:MULTISPECIES: hypothetical protein [Bacillati]|nr:MULTISPECIES: hypothetical protein [Bacillus]EQM25225.1 hypothetical protein N399_24685 [Bacillus licheniformis CG-B52]MDN5390173.1 hypothetical protein [Bacillus sp. LB7]MED2976134.1 hypothetical protein [Bacillus swezeyi]TWK01134.1 hypothetical protein CHCC20442_3941 [Bacillus licheniformis]TWM17400.1 hypothetical protein CHCC15087_3775 [Bacillus licheniformis]
MVARQKESVRLDPEIVSLGRKLAKQDFGSEKKFGLLIENAIRAYHARKVQPVEASSLLSATEQALIDRIEKRVQDMGKQTVERIANLTAKSSFETVYSSIILERIFDSLFNKSNPKQKREEIRGLAAKRMQGRLDKEGAEKISSLIQENKALESECNQIREMLAQMAAQYEELQKLHESLNQKHENQKANTQHYYNRARQIDQEKEELTRQLRNQEKENASLQKKLQFLLDNYSRFKSNRNLIEEYEQGRY